MQNQSATALVTESSRAHSASYRPRTAIIGAGAAGMLQAIKLREAGYDDIVIYEKANEVGGTWRENRYPGIACDVPAHHYNYSFEHNPGWSHRLALGPEIQEYMKKIADKYDLRRSIVFGTKVTKAHFDGRQWQIETSTGKRDTVDFLIAATGPLHVPAFPDIDGIDDFKGFKFHTAEWLDDLDLSDKRVGLIGSGSTGTQAISALAERGINLKAFIRTPQWIFPLPNRRFGKLERAVVRTFPFIGRMAGSFYGWFFEKVFAKAVISDGWQRKFLSGMCKWHLSRVKDPVLRQKLTPPDEPLCKRMVMSTLFYPAVSRPNVEIVREGIVRATENGLIDQTGHLHELDVIIFATGFHARSYHRPIEVTNASGLSLDQAWKDETGAHLSVHVPGFPNFMLIGGPHSPRGNFSAIAYSEAIVDHIVKVIRYCAENGYHSVEARPEALAQFRNRVVAAVPKTIWNTGCRNWYQDENGVPENWTGTPDEFRDILREPNYAEFNLAA
ncbi:MAG: NAD(P)/FAD-dependent oxidoreductase [Sphingomonadaceae bacterium]|nr:NAD(P)/FAD-dependent oxidoreductase [Rhizobiaceae bacterium]MCL4672083.1 NAD(P)/FAD-dependent oxidoreductase [Sphingomonadaceae bacterium]